MRFGEYLHHLAQLGDDLGRHRDLEALETTPISDTPILRHHWSVS